MSFPGHAKSFKLDKRRISGLDGPKSAQQFPASLSEQITHPNNAQRIASLCLENDRARVQNRVVAASAVRDDCGNEATRHLWVGNTGEGRTKHEVVTLLGTKGKIESIRIFDHQSGFMFVNYEERIDENGVCEGIQSAIAAWRDCHEKDIFHRDLPVWVRFTVPESVARKAKAVGRNESWNFARELPPKEPFLDDPARNGRFRLDLGANEIQPSDGTRAEAFALPPPTGPRAMRRSISPPALRRGDSYRPAERSNRDEEPHQPTQRRQSGRTREDDLYRPSYDDDRDSTRRGSDHANIPRHDPRDSLRASDRRNSNRNEARDSEAHERQINHVRIQVTDAQENNVASQEPAFPGEAQGMEIRGLAQSLQQTAAKDIELPKSSELEVSIKGAAARAQFKERDDVTMDTANLVQKDQGFTFLSTLYDSRDPIALAAATPRIRRLKSPLDSVRATNEETISVTSDQTTSSRASSTRKKNCAKCEKPETTLSVLSLRCSCCPRRFHSACVSSSSSITENANFICSRCVRKQKVRVTLGESLAASDRSDSLFTPFTTTIAEINNNGPASSGPDCLSSDQAIDGDITNFVLPQTNSVSASLSRLRPMELARDTLKEETHETVQTTTKYNLTQGNKDSLPPARLVSSDAMSECAAPLTKEQDDYAKAQIVVEKYKREVTCPWWEMGNCRRREEDCLFAHEFTGIGSPRMQRYSKKWTCHRWKFTSSGCQDKNCDHAHYDTGFDVGVNGKPCQKHLTCFYWKTRGHCGKHKDECVFAHHDTGLLAHPPSSHVPTQKGVYRRASGDFTRQFSRQPPIPDTITQQPLQINNKSVVDHPPVPYMPSTIESGQSIEPSQSLDQSSLRDNYDEPVIPQADHPSTPPVEPVDQGQISNTPIKRPKQFARPGGRKPGQPPKDPRKRLQQAVPSEVITTLDSAEPLLTTPNGVNDILNLTKNVETSSAISLAAQTAHSTHASMRGCKFCNKKVFQSDTCRSCQEPAKQSTEVKSKNDTLSAAVNTENAASETVVADDKDTHLDSMISKEFIDQPIRDKTPPIILKRALSGSNMFLSNKRQRPNTSTLFSGSVQKVRIHGTKIIVGQPNIQTLIQQEKAKKAAQQRNVTEVDREMDENMAIVSPEMPASPEKQPIDVEESQRSRSPTPASVYSPPLDITELNISTISAHTPPRVPETQSVSTREHEQEQIDNQLMETTQTSTVMNASAEKELQKWLGPPERPARVLRRSLSSSSSGDSEIPLATSYEARRQAQTTQLSSPNDDKLSNKPLLAGQACKSCRQRRRKCLHKADACKELDPEKCYVDMNIKVSRGTWYNDRSIPEAQLIRKAAAIWAKQLGEPVPDVPHGGKEPEEGFGVSRSATTVDDVVKDYSMISDQETEQSSRSSPPEDVNNVNDHEKVTTASEVIKVYVPKPIVRIPPRRTATSITAQIGAPAVADLTTTETSPPRKHGRFVVKNRETQQDINQPEAEKTTTSPPARLRLIVKSPDRVAVIARLQARGVRFESSNGEDFQTEIPQFDNPLPPKARTTNTFKAIDPLLNHKQSQTSIMWTTLTATHHNQQRASSSPISSLPKPTKGQLLKNRTLLRHHQMLANIHRTGNPHHEVRRHQHPSNPHLRATMQRKIPHDNTITTNPTTTSKDNPLAIEAIMTKEEVMTFQEFLGVPRDALLEPCLFGPMQGLAFREKVQIDRGEESWLLGLRNRRRVVGGEKWPVSER